MSDLKNNLLEQNIVLITTQEECNAVNSLLRLGFTILFYGSRGWMVFQYTSIAVNIKDIVFITQIATINVMSKNVWINKTYIPICLCHNLNLNMA